MSTVLPTTGIDRITQQVTTDSETRLHSKDWQVPLGRPVCFLEQVFVNKPNVQKLEDYVKPNAISWTLLVPMRFKRVRKSLLTGLKQHADEKQSIKMQLAYEYLQANEEDQQLLENYRYSLLKI